MSTYVDVAEILPGEDPTITKESDGTKTGANYRFPIRYVLVDGRVIESTEKRRRLRDAKERLSRLPEDLTTYGTRFRVAVSLDDEGALTGTRTSMMTADYLSAMDHAHQEKGL